MDIFLCVCGFFLRVNNFLIVCSCSKIFVAKYITVLKRSGCILNLFQKTILRLNYLAVFVKNLQTIKMSTLPIKQAEGVVQTWTHSQIVWVLSQTLCDLNFMPLLSPQSVGINEKMFVKYSLYFIVHIQSTFSVLKVKTQCQRPEDIL